MYFDALTLTAVVQELRATILHGRIQRVLLPDSLSIGLEVYAQRQRHELLISAHPTFARVHLVRGKLSRGVDQATPLLLLLRKYLLGGRIVDIEQPTLERTLVLSIVKDAPRCNYDTPAQTGHAGESYTAEEIAGESPTSGPSKMTLIVETMDRRSNIFLVNSQGKIVECVKRVTSQQSWRVALPNHPYIPLPEQSGYDPHVTEATDIQACCRGKDQPLVKSLVRGFRGVSPLVAREALFRTLGEIPSGELDLSDDQAATLAITLRTLYYRDEPLTLASQDGIPAAYAPYRLTHFDDVHEHTSISEVLDQFYTARQNVTAHQQRRGEVEQMLAAARQRLQRILDQLEHEQERAEQLEQWRWEGEMIFAYTHAITPGQSVLVVEGKEIALDPEMSAVENARERFRRYNKARSGLVNIAERLEETRVRLSGGEQLSALLATANDRETIDQIAYEAEEQGYITAGTKLAASSAKKPRKGGSKQRKKQQKVRAKPLHLVSSDGIDIYVGRSSTQNEEVTFRIARPTDLWFHVHGLPGAHVIVRRGASAEIPDTTIREAAGLAAYFSRAYHELEVDVDMTERRQVRHLRGGTPGLVTYQPQETIRVPPKEPW